MLASLQEQAWLMMGIPSVLAYLRYIPYACLSFTLIAGCGTTTREPAVVDRLAGVIEAALSSAR